MWQLQLYRHVQPRAVLELAYLLSNSVKLARSVLQNHSVFTRFLHSIPQMNPLATQLQNFVKTFWSVSEMWLQNEIQRNAPSGWITLPVPISTRASLPGPSYFSPCKISAKSDNTWSSYSDLINLKWPPAAILDVWTKHHLHAKFGEDILISGEDMPPKLNSKQRLMAEFYFRCLFWHVFTYGTFICVTIKTLAK